MEVCGGCKKGVRRMGGGWAEGGQRVNGGCMEGHSIGTGTVAAL